MEIPYGVEINITTGKSRNFIMITEDRGQNSNNCTNGS